MSNRRSIKRTRATRSTAIVAESEVTAASGYYDAEANASNAALLTPNTGGMRRTHLRGTTNIFKRVLVHASGFNLGLVMKRLLGVGTPRGLQGRLAALIAVLVKVYRAITVVVMRDRPCRATRIAG